MLRRVRGAALLCALVLGGCQTAPGDADDPAALDPVAVDTAALATNELALLGRRDLEAGNFGLAERHFRAALERNKDDGPSWLGLAAAYDNLRRFELADRAYREAGRIYGETGAILNNRGYSSLLRGDRAAALVLFRRALAISPGDPVVENNIALALSGERPNRGAIP